MIYYGGFPEQFSCTIATFSHVIIFSVVITMGAKRKSGEFITEGLQRKEAGVDDHLFAFFFFFLKKLGQECFPAKSWCCHMMRVL